ncbi:hypothetical protein K2173_008567 [Erythroxylum novogranatense]|uniref:F-box protein n=1 Tax=Erythroxylum novogranatense TaxID=1862640 RepID=A0AAV8SKS8_9ROSI|nr:hypothetical protein K2173_008567 [Erythroxylum novogranatense]
MQDHHIDDTYYFYQIEIYSSETRSWRLAGDPFLAHVNTLFKYGVFCNNAVHWISAWGHSLYFNIGEEKVKEMPMPPLPEGWEERRYVYFGSNRNHLHLVEIYSPPTTQFDVYEMKSDYSEWLVKYRIDLSEIVAAFPEVVRIHYDPSSLNYHTFNMLGPKYNRPVHNILCIIREEQDEDSYMVLHIPGNIVSYSFKDKTFRKIRDFVPDYANEDHNRIHGSAFGFRWFEVFQFVESFCGV